MMTDCMDIVIPRSSLEFEYGTKYQIKDVGTEEWGEVRIIRKTCSSVRMELRYLIDKERIRIVNYG